MAYKINVAGLGVLLMLWAPFAAQATFDVEASLSTNGVGVEAVVPLNDRWELRGGPRYMMLDVDNRYSNVDYNADIEMLSFSALLDWYAFSSPLRLTFGLVLSDDTIDLTANPLSSVRVGNTSYTAAEVGTLTGEIETNPLQPYIGFGWNGERGRDVYWGFVADAGLLYKGNGDVGLRANGTLAGTPGLNADLAIDVSRTEDDLELLEFYPILSVGLRFRF